MCYYQNTHNHAVNMATHTASRTKVGGAQSDYSYLCTYRLAVEVPRVIALTYVPTG